MAEAGFLESRLSQRIWRARYRYYLGGNWKAQAAKLENPTQEQIEAPKEWEKPRNCNESGGLHIIGTERHEFRRIDNQLRGRSGRQGDPGSSVSIFF